LPPLIIITVVSKFYDAIKNNSTVNAVLLGMRAGVAAVIINVIIIMVLSFLAAVVFNINAALIIVICGVFGAIFYSGLLYKFKGEHK
jgi:chromate transporter